MSAPLDLEELLASCLSRIEHEGEAALEALCAEHPEAAPVLRDRVRLLRGAGLLAAPEGERADFPERLGDFRLLRRLGQGGMGVVYLAEQQSLERRVALKLVRPELLYFAGARQRFAREVEAAARLAHPGIVPVYLVGEERGIPFFAMEYVRGVSLESAHDELRERNPVSLTGSDLLRVVAAATDLRPDSDRALEPPFDGSWAAACVWIAREVAQALEHAHQRGVLHRDVKPSNVMLTPEGRVLLLDFGLASAEGSAVLTGSGARLGSLAYMAPEQVEGRADRIGPATDVYGLGVTLYQLLALRRPFRGEDLSAVQRAILTGAAPRLRSVAPAASQDTEAVVSKAMDPDPERRYASAADLARDLTRLLDQHPVEARAAGPWLQLVRWTQRNRAAATALGLALVIAVGGPLLFGYQQRALGRRILEQKELADRAREQAEAERGEAQTQRTIADRERAEADQQRIVAEREREEARSQRALAESNLGRALEAVELMLERVSERQLIDVPQMEGVRRALLADARRLFTELEGAAAPDVDGRDAEIRWRAAGVGVALAHLERMLGHEDTARALLEDQIEVLRRLVEERGEGRHRGGLALALGRLGSLELDHAGPERALELSGEGLALLEDGFLADTVDGKAWYEVLSVRKVAFERLGREPEALRVADRLLEVARRQLDRAPGDAEARRLLAAFQGERGRAVLGRRSEETVEYVGRGLEGLRALLAERPADGLARLNFCELATTQSTALGLLDRHDEAYELAAEAVAVAATLARDFPTAERYRRQLHTLRVNLGSEAGSIDRVDEAVEALTAGAAGFEELVAADPRAADLWHSLGAALSNLAAVYLQAGRLDEVGEPLRRAIEAHRTAVARQPQNAFYRFHLGLALLNRGMLASEQRDWEAVPGDLDEALPMLGLDPGVLRELALQWLRGAQRIDADGELDPASRNRLVGEFEDGALRALAAAVERGGVGPAELDSDPAFEPLRGREEFEDLRPAEGSE